MAGSGIIGINQIAGSWSARQIFGQVWKAAVEKSVLADARICPTMNMKKLRATIPLMGNLAVQSQLEEFEHAVTSNATPAGVDITLYKDRVRVSVSDEATMDSDVGDPLMLQKGQASSELAGNLESLIATQIATTPQTLGAAVDWGSVSPLAAIGSMVNTLRPYRASAVVMTPAAHAEYVQAITGGTGAIYLGGRAEDLERGIMTVPGYGLPVFVSESLADASANSFAVIANDVPGVILGQGGVKVREWDDQDLGARVYQYDIWRTPLSNLRQTSSTTNLGIVTGVVTV